MTYLPLPKVRGGWVVQESANTIIVNAGGLDSWSPVYNADASFASANGTKNSAGGVRALAAPYASDQGGGTVRFTTSGNHGFALGQLVIIDNDGGVYNGALRGITAIPSATTFELANMYPTSFAAISAGNVRWPDAVGINTAGSYRFTGRVGPITNATAFEVALVKSAAASGAVTVVDRGTVQGASNNYAIEITLSGIIVLAKDDYVSLVANPSVAPTFESGHLLSNILAL